MHSLQMTKFITDGTFTSHVENDEELVTLSRYDKSNNKAISGDTRHARTCLSKASLITNISWCVCIA